MARILVVDDQASIREFLEVLLSRSGHQVATASSMATYLAAQAARPADLVLTDFRLGADSGMDVLTHARALPQPPEVIIFTAFGTTASAVEAMRKGAYDYLTKPFDNDELLLLIDRALEKRTLREENRELRETLEPSSGVWRAGSGAMAAVWALVDKVAPRDATVLITGESGVGKEVVARSIHARGKRPGAPFVAVNCGALAEGVLESELFGHVKGAFTGATSDRAGILVSAGEGTVLLDEIGEVPPSTQVKLLRVLQERQVKPVGSSREVPFAARIIGATNRDLEEEVKAGRFREDLLFRLNVITIDVPPLRARREDVAPLAEAFLRRIAEKAGRPKLAFAPETLAQLERYAFPGNVRQLQNIVERAATLADGNLLTPDLLPPAVRGEGDRPRDVILPRLGPGFSLERALDDLERALLFEALKMAGGVKGKAAELLGLTFRSFRYRLAKHALGDAEELDRQGGKE
ncbi:MAG: sigma-54 dependent transcriptional regulator [Myxococcota bacterium]